MRCQKQGTNAMNVITNYEMLYNFGNLKKQTRGDCQHFYWNGMTSDTLDEQSMTCKISHKN